MFVITDLWRSSSAPILLSCCNPHELCTSKSTSWKCTGHIRQSPSPDISSVKTEFSFFFYSVRCISLWLSLEVVRGLLCVPRVLFECAVPCHITRPKGLSLIPIIETSQAVHMSLVRLTRLWNPPKGPEGCERHTFPTLTAIFYKKLLPALQQHSQPNAVPCADNELHVKNLAPPSMGVC